MGKQPVVVPQGTRYEPYSKASLARRRRGSPPPGGWGILPGSDQAQLTGGMYDLLDDLNTRYGSRDLRELFRDHANPPGALGQAIKTWILYEEIRPVDQLDARHYSGHPDVATTSRSYLQHSPGAPGFDYTPPGERLFADPPNSPRQHTVPASDTRPDSPVADAPPLGSLLRVLRGVAAPPLVSLPSSKPSVVRGSPSWSDMPVVSGDNEQACTSPRSSEGSYHAAFWETAGWTPEGGHQGLLDDGPRIPPYLKGKGKARLRDPNEGGETPEEQDSSGPPQPGNLPHGIPVLASTTLQIEPQDEDSIMIAPHQEGRLDGDEELEHKQHLAHMQPQPQPQPQPRRSARIKGMKDAAPPKVKTPAKSTGRKRAVRKK